VIYCGDCLEILPLLKDKSIDLVLTDPPYGIGEAAGKNKSRGRRLKSRGLAAIPGDFRYKWAIPKDYGNQDWDNKPISDELLSLTIKSAHSAIVWGGNYYPMSPSSCWLVWDKDNGNSDFADCELAWTNLKMAVRKFKWCWNGLFQEDMKNKEIRKHPTQKPLAIMRWCLSLVPNANLILDPFSGSGTIGVAVKQLGRKYILIEIEEKYCRIAVDRLRQEELAI